jgi:hypothetical protein
MSAINNCITYLLPPWSRVFLEKPVVAQLLKFPTLMKLESSQESLGFQSGSLGQKF